MLASLTCISNVSFFYKQLRREGSILQLMNGIPVSLISIEIWAWNARQLIFFCTFNAKTKMASSRFYYHFKGQKNSQPSLNQPWWWDAGQAKQTFLSLRDMGIVKSKQRRERQGARFMPDPTAPSLSPSLFSLLHSFLLFTELKTSSCSLCAFHCWSGGIGGHGFSQTLTVVPCLCTNVPKVETRLFSMFKYKQNSPVFHTWLI